MATVKTTIAERLKEARAARGWTQGELAFAAGVSQGTIGNIESGVRKSLANLVNVAEVLQVSYKWLAFGEGPRQILAEPTPIYITNNEKYPSIRRVSIRLRPGMTGHLIEYIEEPGDPVVVGSEWLTRNEYTPGKLIAITAKDSSMEHSIYTSDTLIVNTEQTTPIDGEVFVVDYEGHCIIRRMLRDGGHWWLNADNPDTAKFPRKVMTATVHPIGQVVRRQSDRI